jgi:hypothetical protein
MISTKTATQNISFPLDLKNKRASNATTHSFTNYNLNTNNVMTLQRNPKIHLEQAIPYQQRQLRVQNPLALAIGEQPNIICLG